MTEPTTAAPAARLGYNDLKAAGLTFPHSHYAVDVDWTYLESHIQREEEVGLDLDPEFQRVHRWTDAQRVAYIEHVLSGGETGKTLLFGYVGKNDLLPKSGKFRHYSLVDGKQRMETVRRFLRGEFRVFPGLAGRAEGWLWSELDRSISRALVTSFRWQLVIVESYEELLRLYLKINRGGTQHTPEEIQKVEDVVASLGVV